MNGTNAEFDADFDFLSETPDGKDADTYSQKLRQYHQLLWSKPLKSGQTFVLDAPKSRSHGYLIHTDQRGRKTWYGSDAITHSYTFWARPKALAESIAALTEARWIGI